MCKTNTSTLRLCGTAICTLSWVQVAQLDIRDICLAEPVICMVAHVILVSFPVPIGLLVLRTFWVGLGGLDLGLGLNKNRM